MNQVICGDSLSVLKTLDSESANCIITSPPYWKLRVYGNDTNELGQEESFKDYINNLCVIFIEVQRVLKKEGTCFVNLGDTYNGIKKGNTALKYSNELKNQLLTLTKNADISLFPKSLCNIPHRFAIKMTDDYNWILRNTVIWHKPNAMPSPVRDRFTVDYEYIFFFVKSRKYYFKQIREPNQTNHTSSWGDFSRKKVVGQMADTIKSKEDFDKYRTQGRNPRCVWSILTKPSEIKHYAMYPENLVAKMIEAGCPEGGIVLDPFAGAGMTLTTAKKLNREFIGIELYPEYINIIHKRLSLN